MDKHTKESIEENAIVGERKRIAEWLRVRASEHLSPHAYLLMDAADELTKE